MNDNNQAKKTVSFHIRTIYLIILLPVLGVVTLVMSLIIHNDLYRDIEQGFDRKLATISTVAGAFIDAGDNEELLRFRTICGLTYVDSYSAIYGIDSDTGCLVTIGERHGGPVFVGTTGTKGIVDLAYDWCNGILYGIDGVNSNLVTLNPDTGEAAVVASLETPCTGLAFYPTTEELFIAGPISYRFNTSTGQIDRLSGLDCGDAITGLCFVRGQERFLAIDGRTNRLIAIDPETLEEKAIGPLSFVPGEATKETNSANSETDIDPNDPEQTETGNSPPETIEDKIGRTLEFDRIRHTATPEELTELRTVLEDICEYTIARMKAGGDENEGEEKQTSTVSNEITHACYGLAWNPKTKTLYTAADRLTVIDSQTGVCREIGWWSGYRSELSDTYLDYVLPMRRIWKKLNITYMYTFHRLHDPSKADVPYNPDDNYESIYTLDVDYNKDHVAIGFTEPYAEDGFKVYSHINMGKVYISDLIYWDEWGLLKSAYAPIYDRKGTIKAVLGTDIIVYIISIKTRIALLKTIGIGFFAFLVAGFVVFGITKAIIKPIFHLKDKTLIVASGQYGEVATLQGPVELRKLSGAFNRLSLALKEYYEQRATTDRLLEEKSMRTKLLYFLQRDCQDSMDWPDELSTGSVIDRSPGSNDISGCIEYLHYMIVWSGTYEGSALDAAKMQRAIVLIVDILLKRFGNQWERIKPRLECLFNESVSWFIYVDYNSGVTYCIDRRSAYCYICDSQGFGEIRVSRSEPAIFQRGQMLILTSEAIDTTRMRERDLCDASLDGADAVCAFLENRFRESTRSSERQQTQLTVLKFPDLRNIESFDDYFC